jgi:predicted neuraminidase
MLRYILFMLCISTSVAKAQNVRIIQSMYVFETAPFAACHASTMVDLGKGKMMAAWFGGKHEGSKDGHLDSC